MLEIDILRIDGVRRFDRQVLQLALHLLRDIFIFRPDEDIGIIRPDDKHEPGELHSLSLRQVQIRRIGLLRLVDDIAQVRSPRPFVHMQHIDVIPFR